MFGGFDAAFFEEYHKHQPKAHPISEYDKRQLLYELFHYLNHTCIFQASVSDSIPSPTFWKWVKLNYPVERRLCTTSDVQMPRTAFICKEPQRAETMRHSWYRMGGDRRRFRDANRHMVPYDFFGLECVDVRCSRLLVMKIRRFCQQSFESGASGRCRLRLSLIPLRGSRIFQRSPLCLSNATMIGLCALILL